MKPIRIFVLGASVAAGLGTEYGAYGEALRRTLNTRDTRVECVNYARPLALIRDSFDIVHGWADCPDLVIVHHGVGDSLIAINPAVLRFAPRRWRARSALDPRVHYSREPWRGRRQRAVTIVKNVVKRTVISATGGSTPMSKGEYDLLLRQLLNLLRKRCPSACIIVLSPPDIDEVWFPGSLRSFRSTAQRSAGIVAARQDLNCRFLDIMDVTSRWEDFAADHFHPNDKGHMRIAEAITPVAKDLLNLAELLLTNPKGQDQA